jgi:hypothetical protein
MEEPPPSYEESIRYSNDLTELEELAKKEELEELIRLSELARETGPSSDDYYELYLNFAYCGIDKTIINLTGQKRNDIIEEHLITNYASKKKKKYQISEDFKQEALDNLLISSEKRNILEKMEWVGYIFLDY